jgi:VCBS repeat-containing protein
VLSVSDVFTITSVAAPVVQSFTVTDATTVNGNTLGKSGEALSFVVTLSEAVTSTASLTAVFTVNGVEVTATAQAVTASNTITFTGGSVPATGNGNAISLKSLTAASGAIVGDVSNQPLAPVTAGAITHALYTVDNIAPSIITTSLLIAENATAVGTLVGTDTNVINWTLDGSGADNGKFNLSASGVLTFKVAANFESLGSAASSNAYTVKVKATDAVGNASTQDITVNVADVNEAPVVSSSTIADVVAVTGTSYTVDTPLNLAGAGTNISSYFVDPDTSSAFNTLTYSLDNGAPSWLQIDPSTGKLYGQAPGAAAPDLAVTVKASDGANTVSKSFNIDLMSRPALQSTQNLANVNNLDVKSALVIGFTENLALGSGQIRIMDNMGTAGLITSNNSIGVTNNSKRDVTDNDVVITLTNGVVTNLTVGGQSYTTFGGVGLSQQRLQDSVKVSGNKLIIDIGGDDELSRGTANTSWNFDWDFGANYNVEFDQGIVTTGAAGPANLAMNNDQTLNFTTVAPADGPLGAASQKMATDGTLSSGYIYHNAHQGNPTSGQSNAIDLDFSTGSHALVIQLNSVDPANSGVKLKTSLGGNTDVTGFGGDDVIYNDNGGNMLLKSIEGLTGATWSGRGDSTTAASKTSTTKRAVDTDVNGQATWTWFSDAPFTVSAASGDSAPNFGFEARVVSNAVIFG